MIQINKCEGSVNVAALVCIACYTQINVVLHKNTNEIPKCKGCENVLCEKGIVAFSTP